MASRSGLFVLARGVYRIYQCQQFIRTECQKRIRDSLQRWSPIVTIVWSWAKASDDRSRDLNDEEVKKIGNGNEFVAGMRYVRPYLPVCLETQLFQCGRSGQLLPA